MKKNYELIALRIIHLLRSEFTQEEISKKLGYSFNQYAKFESGVKAFKVSDFLLTLEILRKQSIDSLSRELGVKINSISRQCFTKDFLAKHNLISETALMKTLGISKTRAWRLKKGRSELKFSELLQIIDLHFKYLFKFLKSFLSCKEMIQLKISENNSCDALDLYKKYPESTYILCICRFSSVKSLSLEEQKNKIWELTRLEKEYFNLIFDYLLERGFLTIENGNYKCVDQRLDLPNTERSLEAAEVLWKMMFEKLNAEYTYLDSSWKKSFSIAPVSESAMKKIKHRLTENYREVIEIIDKDNESKKTELMFFSQFVFSH